MKDGNPFDISGQVALATGAAGGLGHSIFEALVQAGQASALLDVDRDGLAAAASAFSAVGANIVTRIVDVRRPRLKSPQCSPKQL